MKIYIVEATYGTYESESWVHSVHLRHDLAEESKEKISAEWEAKRNTLPPFPVDEYGDLIEDGLSKEEIKEFYKWWHKDHDAGEWGGVKVIEYETEKTYDRLWSLQQEQL